MSAIIKSLAILKKLDDETAIQLIDSAYDYYIDPSSYPLKKLTINVRAPFSAIYSVLKKAGIKVYKDISASSLPKPVKSHLQTKLASIYEINAKRMGLLTTYKDECDKKRIVDANTQIESIDHVFSETGKKYESCQWKVNYILSHSKLHRVMMPEVVIEIQLEDGEKVKMTLSGGQFDELRRQVALLLRSMHQIECIPGMNR
ncbi:unnamed protein product [Moneuplotes crassus]|uniref:COMM domain-containing protein 5 n=1 Tax=Euplotes crassus TaxID=5936 RepID=A0AAD1Y1W1_EUPCR|nr:unnamed protein product [Moneuplotes crassus]